MPDLDLIKQAEQGWDRRGRFAWGRSGNSACRAPPLAVDTFVRAIETSDFERHLQLVEADCSDDPPAVIGMYGTVPGRRLNP
jgi:hypothetical protein